MIVFDCPRKWKGDEVHRLCMEKNENNPLSSVPVHDYSLNISFANAFCVICNKAENFAYWQLKFNSGWRPKKFIKAQNKSIPSLLHEEIAWTVEPPTRASIEYCWPIPLEETLPPVRTNETRALWSLCLSYSFPVCLGSKRNSIDKYRNPHCALLENVQDKLTCICFPKVKPPSFSIVFNFNPSDSTLKDDRNPRHYHSVIVTKRVKRTCQGGQVYDLFKDQCRAYLKTSSLSISNASIEEEKNTSVKVLNNSEMSCVNISYNSSEFVKLPNGSVQIYLHTKMYEKGRYHEQNSSIIICTNFTANYTKAIFRKKAAWEHKKLSTARILTYVGLSVSIVAILLLITRFLLRANVCTLHGKNVISLSCAVLAFQVMFLLSGQTDPAVTCDVITGVMHYSLLSTFMWMGVNAYEITKGAHNNGRFKSILSI